MTDPFLEHLFDDGFEEYRNFMYENYSMIMKYRTDFITDKYFSTTFKCERVRELIDFFELEDEFEKCKSLKSIYEALEVEHLFTEVIQNMKVSN